MPTPLESLLQKLDAVEVKILEWKKDEAMPSQEEANELAVDIRDAREDWFQTLPETEDKTTHRNGVYGAFKERVLNANDKLINKKYDAIEGILKDAIYAHRSEAMVGMYFSSIEDYQATDAILAQKNDKPEPEPEPSSKRLKS